MATLYRIGNEFTKQLPPGADPASVRVAVRRSPSGGWELQDVPLHGPEGKGSFNAVGRVYITLAAYQASKKAEREANERKAADEKAKNEAAKQQCEAANGEWNQAFQDRQAALSEWRSQWYKQNAAELGINADFATVDNVGLFTTSAHDVVDGWTTFFSEAFRGRGGFISDAVDFLNTEARPVTQSGLLGIVPGSTAPTLGIVERADQLAAVGSASQRGLEMLGRANPLIQGGSQALGRAATLTQWSQNYAATGNLLRSQVPLLGNISGLSSDQLRVLANDVRTRWTPNMLERANGLSAEELATEMENLADAKDAQAAAGESVQENPQSGVDAARNKAIGMCIHRK